MRPPYSGPEITTSRNVLKELSLSGLPEPVMLLGGWAVYFTVNPIWTTAFGEGYFGSRDIDLGFHTPPEVPVERLQDGNLSATIDFLTGKHGFAREGMYQFVRYHSWDTHEILGSDQMKRMGQHEFYGIAVDLVASHPREDLREIGNFQAFSEPLLGPAFTNSRHRVDLDVDNSPFWVPAPHLLIGMKLRSLPDRQRDHKAIKDLCDLYALISATSVGPRTLRSRLHRVLPDATDRVDGALSSPFLDLASEHLDQPVEILEGALRQMV